MVYFLTGEKALVTTVADLSNFILIYFPSGRTYMKETVKNMMNRRRQEEHKDETLFLDSILDCDLMNEEEVTAEAHLLSAKMAFFASKSKIQSDCSKNDVKRMQQTLECPVL